MATIKVAIDGPAGAGKSSISKAVADRLTFVYIDTGAMYRAVGLAVIESGKNPENAAEVIAVLDTISISIKHTNEGQLIFLNGKNVSEEIRRPDVSVAASNVAIIPEVRIKLVALQRELAESENVIMDGRDIGTYVLPNADIKIFLTATVEARAKRRFEELSEKGVSTTFDDVKKDMEYRDKNDSGREFAPLKPAENCVFVDSTDMNLSETIEHIFNLINTTFKEIK